VTVLGSFHCSPINSKAATPGPSQPQADDADALTITLKKGPGTSRAPLQPIQKQVPVRPDRVNPHGVAIPGRLRNVTDGGRFSNQYKGALRIWRDGKLSAAPCDDCVKRRNPCIVNCAKSKSKSRKCCFCAMDGKVGCNAG